MFTLKIFFHPDHFLEQELQVGPLVLCGGLLHVLFTFLRQNFYLAVRVTLQDVGAYLREL
jgi:hypothetical protein